MAVMVETLHIACQTENDANESLGCSFCRQMAVMTETRFAACQTEFSAGDSSSKNGRQSAVIVNTRIAACQTEADEYARLVVDQTKTIAGLERARGKRERSLEGALEQLREANKKIEAAKQKNDQQLLETCLLSRQIDQLQRSQETAQSPVRTTSGKFSFIISDLQSQVQSLREKNTKKDSLIRKLAEILSSHPETRHQTLNQIRESTVKPSDRRIDFDLETLCNFLERRKLSYSDHPQSPDNLRSIQNSGERSRQ